MIAIPKSITRNILQIVRQRDSRQARTSIKRISHNVRHAAGESYGCEARTSIERCVFDACQTARKFQVLDFLAIEEQAVGGRGR